MHDDDIPFQTPRRSRFARLRGRVASFIVRALPSRASRVGVVGLMFAVAAGVAWNAFSSAPAFEVKADSQSAERSFDSSLDEAAQPEVSYVVVYVSGAVACPGVYSLAEGSRVNDAVAAAGGLAENAQPSGVNLARVLSDGEQIAIPTQEEAEASVSASAAAQQAGSSGAAASSGLVNINTADAALLQTLSGVGPSTAQAIVSDREKNGPFASVDDLTRVDGIGDKKLAKIRDSICV